jgi:hypothetical protein
MQCSDIIYELTASTDLTIVELLSVKVVTNQRRMDGNELDSIN